MRKTKCLVAMIAVLCLVGCLGTAGISEAAPNRLHLAFGLFSVDLPQGAQSGPNEGDQMSMLRYPVDGFLLPITANFAPAESYEGSAARALDSYVSFMFALIAHESYEETEVVEETLPGGTTLRWRLMKGAQEHVLSFEAFTDLYGYNMCLMTEASDENDEMMLSVMRSFQADPAREQDVLQIRQTKVGEDTFISAEHGLRIRLTSDWEAMTQQEFLYEDTAFILQKDQGEWLIRLMYLVSAIPEHTEYLLNMVVGDDPDHDLGGHARTLGEPYTVQLENLGVEAMLVDEESGIFKTHIAFVYEGYGYAGSFMWIKDLDKTARPWMQEAILTLAPAEM